MPDDWDDTVKTIRVSWNKHMIPGKTISASRDCFHGPLLL